MRGQVNEKNKTKKIIGKEMNKMRRTKSWRKIRIESRMA